MFKLEELQDILIHDVFNDDLQWVRQSLALHRFHQDFPSGNGATSRLTYFVESVLASAPSWEPEEGLHICHLAAEIAELLSLQKDSTDDSNHKMRIRSALLYELAEEPVLSSSMLKEGDMTGVLSNFFFRKGIFGGLTDDGHIGDAELDLSLPTAMLLNRALSADAWSLAQYEQGFSDIPSLRVSDNLSEITKYVSMGMSSTEVKAFSTVISKRLRTSTRSNVDTVLFQMLKGMNFPAELWSTQVEAIRNGLIDYSYDSWGFAAPTGTGKTFLANVLIAKTLLDNPEANILYIVPSRALVHEVWSKLDSLFSSSGYKIIQVSPQLTELDNEEDELSQNCSVAVLTPEKADLLLRLGTYFMQNLSLIIVDEAHHIESGNRGVLLELYLWRIKQLFKRNSRIVFLSAVTPNIKDLAGWIGERSGGMVVNRRATRMRAGVYRIKRVSGKKQGWVEYSDRTSVQLVPSGVETAAQKQLLQLCEGVSSAGPVLVVAKGKGTCETLARKMREWVGQHGRLKNLSDVERNSEVIQRLDSRLEREMYESVEMRTLINNRIAYHHAGLPPRVRIAVEEAIRAELIDYVFATTTLAEGVNFPFSSVIVESLALREAPEHGKPVRYHPVTPRSFWNIAGRAGRPGHDREGQVILFEPSLGLDKVSAVLENYLNPSIDAVGPVQSALAKSIQEIAGCLQRKEFDISSLNNINLSSELSKNIRGTVNLLRLGIIHAKAARLFNAPEEIFESTFAAQSLSDLERKFASHLCSTQSKVVDDFLNDQNTPPINVVAELGLSMETLSEIQMYVRGLENWQLDNMKYVMHGGEINVGQIPYVIGPVAKRMAELEGPKLGGFYGNVAVHWLSGIPLTTVKSQSNYSSSIENLISIIYSRIQYLLPWGLYAMHRVVNEEVKRRRLSYNDEILSLSFLVDTGVPSFDALRLVGLDFERVDATRLAKEYKRRKSSLDTDIVGWLSNIDRRIIESCIRGTDNRRIDYDLSKILSNLTTQT